MKNIFCLLLSFVLFPAFLNAQIIQNRDSEISHLINSVNEDSLKSNISNLVSFKTRNTLSSPKRSENQIGAARDWAYRFFKNLEEGNPLFKAELQEFDYLPDGRRVNRPIKMANVIGKLEGSDPQLKNQIIIVSAHIDSRASNVMDSTSIAPGANDDGSGTALVMELARVLAKSKFKSSIWFVLFSGEEQGLLGAKYLADKFSEEKLNLIAQFNNDIIGSNHSSGTNIIDNTKVRIFSTGIPSVFDETNLKEIQRLGLENDGGPRNLARYIKEVGERYVDNLEVKLIFRNDRFLRGGDHSPFVVHGYNAVRISEMNEDYHAQHQDVRQENGIDYGDTPEKMDFQYLKKNCQLNLAGITNLALSPPSPNNVLIDATSLSNSTKLSWESEAKGFYVLIRETHQAFWQRKIYTEQQNIELALSKDNYFFALQSVDDKGHESLIVTPNVKYK